MIKNTWNETAIYKDLLNTENCVDAFFETQNCEQPLVLFGAGFALKRILLKIEKHGLNISCICDNDKAKQGTFFDDRYEVLSVENCMSRFPNAIYIISSPSYFWEIKNNLEKIIDKKRICNIDFECSHYFSGKEFKHFFINNIKRFGELYGLLSDNISKRALYNVIKAHISGKREDFEVACTGLDDWYLFNSLLIPRAESVYLDCGAYDGDTVLLFKTAATKGYKSIIAFEPDETIHLKLQTTISSNNIHNIQIIKKGAYNYTGSLGFTQGGVYSTVTNSNKSLQPQFSTVEIDVTTIDSVLNGGFVDIIKMDIEGAEYKALLGAENSIRKHRPRLAICLYHNVEDFIEIPELILRIVPEYKLFLRHHSESCTDTILYAVP